MSDTANYSVPRECGLPGCDFATLNRQAFWSHVMAGHDTEPELCDDSRGPDPDEQHDLRDER
jgi:hypothetical protein